MDVGLHAFLCATFACTPETALSIGQRATHRHYPTHAVIVRQGDHVTMTFLLVEGRVHALACGADGQTVLLQEFGCGDFFGAVVDTQPDPASADLIAVEPSRAATFLSSDFVALLERHGCMGLVLSRMLLKQLRLIASKMTQRVTLSAAGRVYAELLRLARQADGRTIRPAPVVASMAMHVQTTRETASRAISALERRGIVRRDKNALFIVAPQRLEELIV